MIAVHFDAIIFDCEGTLVDSEHLGNQVLVNCAAEVGVELSLDEAMAQFVGGKMADAVAFIEQRAGRPLPTEFTEKARHRMADAFQANLKPVPGVEAVLQCLVKPFCVASSGPRDKIELSLGITGLLPYFQGRIFSAYDVGSWKPEPGLFLHAADELGIAPHRCAVVEDSVPGIRAGVAAGMTVFAYAPSNNAADLAEWGAHPFSVMDDLLGLLQRGRPLDQ